MKALLLAVIVLALGLGGWLIFRNDPADQNQQTELSGESAEPPASEQKPSEIPAEKESEQAPAAAEDEPEEAEAKTHLVSYGSGGFSPATLTINPGDTVVFRNDSSRQMWVASNPHPAHSDFSQFDSNEGVSGGETYQFTFSEKGQYGFHNHLRSSDGGTIVVQ